MDTRDILNFIRKVPLFAICTDEELSELLKAAELKSVNTGDIIFKKGDPGERFFIIYSGKIRLILINELKKEINLGIIAKGEHFGETALITECSHDFTARAVEDSVLISVDRYSFNKILFVKPAFREYFDKFIKYTSIKHFLKTFTDFAVASPEDLQILTKSFNLEFFKKGEVVFRQGAIPDKFYLIETGKLKVIQWEGERSYIINFLQEGDFFGDKALFEETPRTADVVCVTDCSLFSLNRESFNFIFEKSPKIKKVIEDRIQTYYTTRPPAAYLESIKQQLAAFKKISVETAGSTEELIPTKDKKKRLKRLSSFYHRHFSFPFIQQHDQMTCGTTCVMMIAKYYGKSFSSSRIRELANVDLSGSSLADLASASEQLGFSTRGLKLDYETLMTVSLPCIVHWQGYHYIVVYKIDPKNVWISDPARGNQKYTRENFEENWNGITLTLEPTAAFERQSEDKSSLKNFIQFFTPHKTIFMEIFLASLLLNIFGLATPIFTQNIVDKILIHQNISLLNIMLLGMLIILVFRILTLIVQQYLIIHTSMKIDLRMLVVFYKHMLSLPLGYFKVRKIGDFITRFGENIKIRNFLTNTALTIILDAIMVVVYLSLMLFYSVQLTAVVLIIIPLFILITLCFTPVLKRLNVESFNTRAEVESHLIESINAIDTVKAMNIEYQTRWEWENKFIKNLNFDFKLANTAMYFKSFGEFIATVGSTTVLWYGAHQVIQNAMSVGELMAFMALMSSVIAPVNRIVSCWDKLQQTLVSVDRLNDIFMAKPERPDLMDKSTDIIIKDAKGEIAFEKVFFRYRGEEDPYILSNINFKIQAGQILAIVGRSGAGKTTLVRLIARLYDVTEGKITIDGHDIKNINLSNLRKLIGFVLQENYIFNTSIRKNISIGESDDSLEKVIEVAKLANAHDFISGLAQGYETKVGDSGLQLSSGQKQRIAIARALYNDPRIIIFDEATSSLDAESEKAIQKNLNAMIKNKTAIIIAHRLSTVRIADNILVLDNGEIVEKGNHEELMAKRGLYQYLNYQQLNI